MMESSTDALQLETEFLSGVANNLDEAKGGVLRGSTWEVSNHDDGDRLRALLAENRRPDRKLLKSLPSNRRTVLRGFDRRFLFWKRQTGVAIASTLSPLEHYAAASDKPAPSVGLGELADHVRKLTGDSRIPHVIGVCSPTGFTDEARSAQLSGQNVSVVLIEPDGAGGWGITAAGEPVDPRLLKIFDPESAKQKMERVRALLEDHSAELLTGGVSLSSIARKANLPKEMLRSGFEKIAQEDPELRLAKDDGDFVLYRGAPTHVEETKSMNVIDRIKQLLAGDGDEKAKINLLAERRALLAQRRDRLYEDIGKLENKEAEMLEQGKAAKSSVPRRRLAAQLAQLRKDIGRQNASAAMLNQQINIISTDIHNLTLIQQGEMAKLPDTVELTEHAVAAEEMLENLKADSELVTSLEQGMEESLASDEELAILKEFEQADEPAAAEAIEPAEPTQRDARQVDAERTPPATAADVPPRRSAEPTPTSEPEERNKAGEAEAN